MTGLGLVAWAGFSWEAHAGAWTQRRGEGVWISTVLVNRSNAAFDGDGAVIADRIFYKDEASQYGEIGLSDQTTLVTRLAWQTVRLRSGPNSDSAEGLGASEIGLRRQLHTAGPYVVSSQLSVLIPGEGENLSNQPLGEGGWASDLRLLAGRSLDEGVFDGFVDAQLGWRWRDGTRLDEARLDLTWGQALASRIDLLLQSHSVWSVEGGRGVQSSFAQHKLSASLLVEWQGRRLQAGLSTTPFGRNSHRERAVFLSVWRRF